MTARRYFIAGNWKMNLVRESAQRLAATLVGRMGSVSEVDVGVFPPFPYLAAVHDSLAGSRIKLGAQNMHFEASGAFTGEVSPTMINDLGGKLVLIGHSERRHILGETDEFINRKVMSALAHNLAPVLCVGETLAQRQEGITYDVVANQIRHGLVGVRLEQLRDIIIAYEPVWAIGTGQVATPEQAEDVHQYIRSVLTKVYGMDLSQVIRIVYGGSVKADNAAGLLSRPNIDGALVGGASLNADEFTNIVQAAVSLSVS